MTISSVFLRDATSGELVEADLVSKISDEHLLLWERQWVPIMQEFSRKESTSGRPEDSHWDWRNKIDKVGWMISYESFAITCQDELQGLMIINDTSSARLAEQFGKPLIYIEFVSTAPWNRPRGKSIKKFRGVGKVLVATAIRASINRKYRGRVGLHALPASERFYEEHCGFVRMGPDSSHRDLCYFEMTEARAKALLA